MSECKCTPEKVEKVEDCSPSCCEEVTENTDETKKQPECC